MMSDLEPVELYFEYHNIEKFEPLYVNELKDIIIIFLGVLVIFWKHIEPSEFDRETKNK